jgi:prepilin-type N-terminal cleavage/methylation domain-containing protein
MSSFIIRFKKGFTLIELLIVVAIIAILAAIAVPNFLEAQQRAKVSRSKADLRSVATGLEAYAVDNNIYPPTPFVDMGDSGVLRVVPNLLSTPIAYISTANFEDVFIGKTLGNFEGLDRNGNVVPYGPDPAFPLDPGGDPNAGKRYYYQAIIDRRRSDGAQAALLPLLNFTGAWEMASLGPNERRDRETIIGVPGITILLPYDPTNGTVSDGDIVRTQRESEGSINP